MTELQPGVAKRLKRIERSLNAIESGKPHEFTLDDCSKYVGWLVQYKKVPKSIWEPICDRITALYDAGFGL